MNQEERRVLRCVKQWLEIKMKFQGAPYYQSEVISKLIPDIDHSELLPRLLRGEKPLPLRPDNYQEEEE